MTPQDFWHGDIRLLGAYQKAYLRHISYTAWFNGQYNAMAYDMVIGNAFTQGKKQKYPEWEDPVKKIFKPKIKNEDFEQLFRNEQVAQNAWLRNLKKQVR